MCSVISALPEMPYPTSFTSWPRLATCSSNSAGIERPIRVKVLA